jgi:hypothetical protein
MQLAKEKKRITTDERRQRLRERLVKCEEERKANPPRVQELSPESEVMQRLAKLNGKANPLGNLIRADAIKREASLFRGREARLKPSGREGVYPPTFRTKYMVWGRAGSAYSIPEEFAGYCMIEFVKHLLFFSQSEKERLSDDEERILLRFYEKYFSHGPEEKDIRAQFDGLVKKQAGQDLRMSPFQKFMFDFSSYRNSYFSALTRDSRKHGIASPQPANIIVYDTFDREEDAIRFYDELKSSGEDTERLFVSPIGALVPLNPNVFNTKTDIAQSDAAKIIMGSQRNQQLGHEALLKKTKWEV